MSGPTASFDASAWLSSYVEAGGAYVLTLSGSPVFLIAEVDGCALAGIMRQVTGRPDRLRSVRDKMEAPL